MRARGYRHEKCAPLWAFYFMTAVAAAACFLLVVELDNTTEAAEKIRTLERQVEVQAAEIATLKFALKKQAQVLNMTYPGYVATWIEPNGGRYENKGGSGRGAQVSLRLPQGDIPYDRRDSHTAQAATEPAHNPG